VTGQANALVVETLTTTVQIFSVVRPIPGEKGAAQKGWFDFIGGARARQEKIEVCVSAMDDSTAIVYSNEEKKRAGHAMERYQGDVWRSQDITIERKRGGTGPSFQARQKLNVAACVFGYGELTLVDAVGPWPVFDGRKLCGYEAVTRLTNDGKRSRQPRTERLTSQWTEWGRLGPNRPGW